MRTGLKRDRQSIEGAASFTPAVLPIFGFCATRNGLATPCTIRLLLIVAQCRTGLSKVEVGSSRLLSRSRISVPARFGDRKLRRYGEALVLFHEREPDRRPVDQTSNRCGECLAHEAPRRLPSAAKACRRRPYRVVRTPCQLDPRTSVGACAAARPGMAVLENPFPVRSASQPSLKAGSSRSIRTATAVRRIINSEAMPAPAIRRRTWDVAPSSENSRATIVSMKATRPKHVAAKQHGSHRIFFESMVISRSR